MLSFFAIPLLLGDITLDFMNTIDIGVNVMVTNTATGSGSGANNQATLDFTYSVPAITTIAMEGKEGWMKPKWTNMKL